MVKQSTSVGRLVLIATMSLLLSACGGGGGGGGAPPPVTGVSGAATNTRGGPAVQGATITASGTMVSATTNSQGAYTLSLSPGTYDILAAAPAAGMAASKFQSVGVTANKTTTANLIMFPVFDPTKPVAAPTISVTGLTQGQTVQGTVPFTVTVTASNPVRRIDLRTSTMSALPQTEFVDTTTALNVPLISTALTNGPAFVDIITYDLNQNVAELMVNFTVSNPISGTAPASPTGFSLTAVTTGQSLGLFSTRRAQLFTQLGVNQDPSILRVGGRSINILTAPSNATLFVEARWSPVTGATGYKVFRSPSAGGPFLPVAQITYACNASPPASCFYDDPDPSLTPGVPVYYQVSAFNAGGESAPTTPVGVTPLPAFNLTLASPTSNATGVSATPLFTWTLTAPVGTDQLYDIFVTGLNDPSPAWKTSNFSIFDVTSVSFGGPVPLQSGKVYQWDIYEAQAQTFYCGTPPQPCPPSVVSNSAGIAVANGSGQVATGSLNGPFTFTTAL